MSKQHAFATAHSLGYPLLADEAKLVAKKLGAWRWWLPGSLHTRRRTFVIGQDRRIIHAIADEKLFDRHADEALEVLKKHRSAA